MFYGVIPLHAQSLSPQVINTGGLPSMSGTVSLDYSIGEQASITQYNASSNVKLTAGFLQTFTTLVTGLIPSPSQEEVALQLFPNPASDYTTVKGAVSKPGYLEFQLIDLQGRVLESVSPTYYQNRVEKEFSISSLGAGLYLIRLTYSSDGYSHVKTLKLIKSYR
jgi:Secretion system C-terminal sorting domain